jgi:hypothetical protein
MIRHLFLVVLLATGLALAEGKPADQPASSTGEPQAQTEAKPAVEEQALPAADQPVQVPAAKEAKEDGGSVKDGAEAKKADEGDAKPKEEEAKLVSVPGGKALGMSILGNQEAPKALVIVPWKSSELGREPGVSPLLDDSRKPVDREVFMRELRYYEIRSESKH